jgi:hypothetical protein
VLVKTTGYFFIQKSWKPATVATKVHEFILGVLENTQC